MAEILAKLTSAALDKTGRVIVNPDFNVPGTDNIFVIGDLAHYVDREGKTLPGVAPVAMQSMRYAHLTTLLCAQ